MRPASYPFAAIVGQAEMKLALLLAATDWRLGVLLRGDKGSGKTTSARALAALLPSPAPFINLPIGATEDRLLGGLHLERTLKGDPVLKPGLLAEAHGGILYVDEVNLLPPHLGDALLDAAASGIHFVEREGLSASHRAEFVLLGSMNPEEGSLRPQMLDRFALSVAISASLDPAERGLVVERRLAFERTPDRFTVEWLPQQQRLQQQIAHARESLPEIRCPGMIVEQVSTRICEERVRSLRADLAVIRAATAYAALAGDETVQSDHVAAVLPLVLAHRTRDGGRSAPPNAPPPPAPPQPKSDAATEDAGGRTGLEHIFAPRPVETPALHMIAPDQPEQGRRLSMVSTERGAVVLSQPSATPSELDLRATLQHALRDTGSIQPRVSDLHERVRQAARGVRFLFVIDSSGSHAAQERMRLVKGATAGLLTRSFERGDEVVLIVFRGTSAEVVLEPTKTLADAIAQLEYLPTGGRTPLAHALDLARSYVSFNTMLVLITDGRANYPMNGGDPWQEALEVAGELTCSALLIDTGSIADQTGKLSALAKALQARCLTLAELVSMEGLRLVVHPRTNLSH